MDANGACIGNAFDDESGLPTPDGTGEGPAATMRRPGEEKSEMAAGMRPKVPVWLTELPPD